VTGRFDVLLAGPVADPVRSSHGQRAVADLAGRDAPPPEIELFGGIGTRRLVEVAGSGPGSPDGSWSRWRHVG
jgi:hypothetical protein